MNFVFVDGWRKLVRGLGMICKILWLAWRSGIGSMMLWAVFVRYYYV
jgi:hypothetical protein